MQQTPCTTAGLHTGPVSTSSLPRKTCIHDPFSFRTQSMIMKRHRRTFYTLVTLWMLYTIVLNLRPAFSCLIRYIYIYKCVNTYSVCVCVFVYACRCAKVCARTCGGTCTTPTVTRLKYGLCQTLRCAASHKKSFCTFRARDGNKNRKVQETIWNMETIFPSGT